MINEPSQKNNLKRCISDPHFTKKSILVKRGIIKQDDADNLKHQLYLPRGFSLNLCGHCTYKCSYCPQSVESYPEEYINPDIIYKVFRELDKKAVYVQMSARGESLLHPDFFKIVRFIKSENSMSYICLNTNGYIIDDLMMGLLFDSGIDQILFSLQTMDPILYNKICMSPHHQKVVDRILKFVKMKDLLRSDLIISVQFLSFPENSSSYKEFADYWASHDVGVLVQHLHSWGNKMYTDRVTDGGRYPCPYLWLYPTITHTGHLSTCFIDFNQDMTYGSLETDSLSYLWRGERAVELREKHLRSDWGAIPLCSNCSGYKIIKNPFKYCNGRFSVT